MINHKKKRHHTRYFILAAFTLVSLISFNPAPDIKVKDMKELNEAVAAVKPGGKIMLANGIWKDVEILLNAKGTEKAPFLYLFIKLIHYQLIKQAL